MYSEVLKPRSINKDEKEHFIKKSVSSTWKYNNSEALIIEIHKLMKQKLKKSINKIRQIHNYGWNFCRKLQGYKRLE